jgi:hypothetical protein
MSNLNGSCLKFASILYQQTLWRPGSYILTNGIKFHHTETIKTDLQTKKLKPLSYKNKIFYMKKPAEHFGMTTQKLVTQVPWHPAYCYLQSMSGGIEDIENK